MMSVHWNTQKSQRGKETVKAGKVWIAQLTCRPRAPLKPPTIPDKSRQTPTTSDMGCRENGKSVKKW
jgi:hypothetical protein